jgi:hypothetical protein
MSNEELDELAHIGQSIGDYDNKCHDSISKEMSELINAREEMRVKHKAEMVALLRRFEFWINNINEIEWSDMKFLENHIEEEKHRIERSSKAEGQQSEGLGDDDE